MRKPLLFLLAALAFAPFAHAADESSAIRTVLSAQQDAWNRGDVDNFVTAYKDAPDTTFIGSKIRQGYARILESYKKNYATKEQMGKLTYSDIEVRLLPCPDGQSHYAAVTGRFHLDRTAHGTAAKDDGVFSLLWEKTASGWKIVLDHSS
ncbi:SgcJ/EcaC family oxidoreductase [Dyella sp. LX-66]|uniref:YybH family protein n=1 Tax=unclassified Dyella TaxID=2634549 RepID=UPI001BE0AA20|nr:MULTISPECIES: nuclear transport factor 2 family protein [unclassified Dyella]MBT2118264.1 SgcJ/EcaC family oxidoreductase [Dyella sp. LX-1]MBT2138710.1 SgcJ/EcaC family oxidoreductase [Dyella sp. LX-66]